jgi:hypothetical protein
MPLSYSCVLGGCLTIIGTSTNLVVNGACLLGHAQTMLMTVTRFVWFYLLRKRMTHTACLLRNSSDVRTYVVATMMFISYIAVRVHEASIDHDCHLHLSHHHTGILSQAGYDEIGFFEPGAPNCIHTQ